MSPERENESSANAPRADREAFVARLQRIVRHWRSAERLARTMGVSPSAFRKWLKGEAEPSRERLIALADAAGVGVAWLATGEGPSPRFDGVTPNAAFSGSLDKSQFLLLPKTAESAEAAAGSGTPPPDPRASVHIAFGHDWVRRSFAIEPEELMLETAIGKSMQPTIRDGDIILIDSTDRQFREFGVYVLEYHGERLVKRVQRKLDGGLLLISDNAIYEPERIPSERASGVTVVGRVVWSGGKL